MFWRNGVCEMKVNDIVVWTFKDADNGKFGYTGQIVAITNDRVEVDVEDEVFGSCTLGVELADGKFKVIGHGEPKPARKPVVVKSKPAKVKVAPTVKRPKGDTRTAAVELYKSMIVVGAHPSRAEVVNAFITKLGMGKNTASTYQHNCKTKWCRSE